MFELDRVVDGVAVGLGVDVDVLEGVLVKVGVFVCVFESDGKGESVPVGDTEADVVIVLDGVRVVVGDLDSALVGVGVGVIAFVIEAVPEFDGELLMEKKLVFVGEKLADGEDVIDSDRVPVIV